MSKYEDYHTTAANYDQTRTPPGLEILLGCFAANPRPLSEQTVLDAGCGTGTCIRMLSDKIGYLHGLELNENMLHRAQENLQEIQNVHLRHGKLPELPYEAESFDGLMCNQVLHHLGSGRSNSTFPELTRLLEEAHRVLRPNGVIILNTSSQQQLRDGFWWADLIPQAVERIAVRFPPIEMIEAALRAAGFCAVGRLVSLHEVLQGRGYLDPQGPLQQSYRDGDSTWSLAEQKELDAALERVHTMNAQGTMAAYLEQREALRKNIGQATFVFARKA
jgi:ubiquinone/menaquinone biosynthesis C-methylase UbiE